MSTNLNNRQQIAIALLASGLTSSDVAEKINVTKETISRWFHNEAFRAELKYHRVEFFEGLIKKQYALFFKAQQQIELALTDEELPIYQRASIALRFMSQFAGNMNRNKQLSLKQGDIRCGP